MARWRYRGFIGGIQFTNFNTYANPTSSSGFEINKDVAYTATSTLDGHTVMRVNGFSHNSFSISGKLYVQEDVENMESLMTADYLVITDDLDRTHYVCPESIKMDRDYSKKWPWGHTYTLSATAFAGNIPPLPLEISASAIPSSNVVPSPSAEHSIDVVLDHGLLGTNTLA